MKRLKYLSTLLVAAVALIAAWLLWNFYTQSPWTRDGKVRAEQVGITPQVSGSILQLNVTDNQRVKPGSIVYHRRHPLSHRGAERPGAAGESPGGGGESAGGAKARPPARLAVAEACRKMPSRLKTLRTSIPP